MKKYERKIPTVEEFTGVDLYGVDKIVYGEDKNGKEVYAYSLYQLAEKLGVKRARLLGEIPKSYIITSTNEFGQELLFIIDEGLYLLLNQLEVKQDEFKEKTTKILFDICQYGINIDNELNDNIVEIISSEDLSMNDIYEFLDSLID